VTPTAKEQIAKLEALLRRVLARVAEPRPMRFVEAFVPQPPDDVPPSPAPPEVEPQPSVVVNADANVNPWSVAVVPRPSPPSVRMDAKTIETKTMPELDDDVVAEPVIDLAPPPMAARESEDGGAVVPPDGDSTQSIERLKAATKAGDAHDVDSHAADSRDVDALMAEPIDDIPPPSDTDVLRAQAQDDAPQLEVAEVVDEADVESIDASAEEEEPAPSSSRRPVTSPPSGDAERGLAELAFGEEPQQSPAMHTPPPESGRLPAAPPVEFDMDVTGVREAAKMPGSPRDTQHDDERERATIAPVDAPIEPAPPEAVALAPPIGATRAPSNVPRPTVRAELRAETTRAEVASSSGAQVTDAIGEAQRWKPATFGELLDATLSLS
jgi:hypothetical protein